MPRRSANLGATHAAQGNHDEAIACYDRALAIRPDAADVYYNRGNSLVALGRADDGLQSFDEALRRDSQFVEAWTNRGVLLRRRGHLREALECHRRVLQLRTDSADGHSNYGLCLSSFGRVDDALDHYDRALKIQPDNPGALSNRAQLYLLKSDFRRGWPEYESRWRLGGMQLPDRGLPRWDGSSLNGKSILLRHEQGFGDTVMFCRYAALVHRQGGRVVLECPKRLHRLLTTCTSIDAFLDRTDPIENIACEAPLLSLPGTFHSNLRSIPATVPYLRAEQARIDRWRARLPKDGLRVGISWQGNPNFPEDAMRSIPLRHFAPLANVANVKLVSLQMGKGVEQMAPLAGKIPIHDLGAELDADGAFLDTAALMMNLDLIISSDTAVVHLAGALARPVWIALSTGPEWRWLRDRDDSPWYPTARLFRQERFGDWDGVFARIRDELAAFKAQPPGRAK